MKWFQTKVVPLVLCAMVLMLRGAIPAFAASSDTTAPVTSVPTASFHAMVLQISDDPLTGDDGDDSGDDDPDGGDDGSL